MSWNKQEIKKKYKRAEKHATFYTEEQDNDDWYFYDYHSDCPCCDNIGPTMYDVVWGRFLRTLTRLKIRQASELLDEWYW